MDAAGMNTRILFLAIALHVVVPPILAAESDWIFSQRPDGTLVIGHGLARKDAREATVQTLRPLLAQRSDDQLSRDIVHIWLSNFFSDNISLQKELRDGFRVAHPDLFAAALKSAGNLHNPKVIALANKLENVLLKTSTIAGIGAILTEAGYSITDMSFEKFHIDKRQKPPRLAGFVWLKLARSNEAGPKR